MMEFKDKRNQFINLTMEQSTQVNGTQKEEDQVMESRYGLMAVGMKDYGIMIWQMDRVD